MDGNVSIARKSRLMRLRILIPMAVALLIILISIVLFLRTYLPVHTRSYFTDFTQYTPSYLPKQLKLERAVISVAPQHNKPNQYIKLLMFNAGNSLSFEEEKQGEISPTAYRESCAQIPKGFADACNDATSPSGQKYVYTDYSYSLHTTLVIVSWSKGDTYLSITSTDPTIESAEYAKIIDSMQPTLFTNARISEK